MHVCIYAYVLVFVVHDNFFMYIKYMVWCIKCMVLCTCIYVCEYVICMHVYMFPRMYVYLNNFFSTVSDNACQLSDGMRVLSKGPATIVF